jgi:hypothetical protein
MMCHLKLQESIKLVAEEQEACFPFRIDFKYGMEAGLPAGVRELLKMIFPAFLVPLPTLVL